MIEKIGFLPTSSSLRRLAKLGDSARDDRGFSNCVSTSHLASLVGFVSNRSLVPTHKWALNFWGDCSVAPHQDDVDCWSQILWAITWPKSVVFQIDGKEIVPNPGELWLFDSTQTHSIENPKSRLWSCFVLDVDRI